MNLPSNVFQKRHPRAGFTLIEVMISFALVALVMGAVMVTLSRATSQQAIRLHRLWLTEFARSVLEESAISGAQMTTSGVAEGGWNWQLSERPVQPDPPGVLQDQMRYMEINAQVWHSDRPEQIVEIETLVARRK